jgi:hypothetical protein
MKCLQLILPLFAIVVGVPHTAAHPGPALVYNTPFKASIVLRSKSDRDSTNKLLYYTVKMMVAAHSWDNDRARARAMLTGPILGYQRPAKEQPHNRRDFMHMASAQFNRELEGLKLSDLPEGKILKHCCPAILPGA